MQPIADWFKHQLSNPQVVFLSVALVCIFVIVYWFGDMLAPLLVSVVIAYLLDGLVRFLEQRKCPHLLAVLLIFSAFLLFLFVILFGLLPLLSAQLTQLAQQIPVMLGKWQTALLQLPESYPDVISAEQVNEVIRVLRSEVTQFGQDVVTYSLTSVVGIVTFLVYAVLVPILVFFFLKDGDKIIQWISNLLPRNRKLANQVWSDVDRQIGNYVRGKFWEILIVWLVSFVTFSFFGLQYAMLLGVIVGLSVIIPYVGAAVVTIPVLLIAWFQWGWSPQFIYVAIAYLVIQALDGNLLVPVLFSEVVNLHPVAIIVAVLVFGGLWGFWGVFFAIPLATLVQALLTAWPKASQQSAAA